MGNILSGALRRLSLIYRLLAMLVAAAVIVVIFPHRQHGEHFDYKVGGVWRGADLVAPYDFAVLKTADELRHEEERERQKAIVYYTVDSTAHARALERLAERHKSLSVKEKNLLHHQIDSIYRRGYISLPADYGDMAERTIVVLHGNVGGVHRTADYINPTDLEPGLLRDSLLLPSIVPDDARTTLELDSRLSQISYSSRMVMEGERIIMRGEVVSEEVAQVLRSLEQESDRRFADRYNVRGEMLGQFLLAIIAFIALYIFLTNTRNPILDDDRKVIMVLLLMVVTSAVVALMVRVNADWVLLVPLCVVPILMRVFFDMRVALYVHLTTVIILASLVPNSYEFIFYQLITGMMSIVAVRGLERRSGFFVLSLVIFASYSAIYTAGVLSQDTNFLALDPSRYLIFFLNAMLTLLAYPLIYLFEWLFGLTTSLTLLELSSTNRPALRELSKRAPGTFQHSMQVANIAEDIVGEIGGNAVLTRVGALYHDIGKMSNPLYFTENQVSGFNPHGELEYAESAEIITAHVTDGLRLARKYRLPAEVQNFIRTHHGTTYTGYFYAKEIELKGEGNFDTTRFRYPGPRPFSRETAIVMIVDTVEAACRSLKNHSKADMDSLIDRLIDGKIASHQLDNCDLTYGDVALIRKILKDKMMSVYHVRVAYPTVQSSANNTQQQHKQ